jgi:hypothetical protein
VVETTGHIGSAGSSSWRAAWKSSLQKFGAAAIASRPIATQPLPQASSMYSPQRSSSRPAGRFAQVRSRCEMVAD